MLSPLKLNDNCRFLVTSDGLPFFCLAEIRRPLFRDLFSGTCGHAYGHHSVWQMFSAGRAPVNPLPGE